MKGRQMVHDETSTFNPSLDAPRYRHKKRAGSLYCLVDEGSFQISDPRFKELDGKPVVVYIDAYTGDMYLRLRDEFFDGRFEHTTDLPL